PVAAQRKLALVEHRQCKCFLRKARTRAAQLDRLGLRLRVRLVPAQRCDRSAGGQIDAPVAAIEIARVGAAQSVRCLGEEPQLLPLACALRQKLLAARIDSGYQPESGVVTRSSSCNNPDMPRVTILEASIELIAISGDSKLTSARNQ